MVKSRKTPDRASVPDAWVAELLGAAFERIREALPPAEWSGLRLSQLRVLSSVPEDGLSVTELADRVRMTKQAAGQFVDALVDLGLLAVQPRAGDRRVRWVRRTAEGDALVGRLSDRFAALEASWAQAVGERRYATFRRVLGELGRTVPDGADPGPGQPSVSP
ncbi:DNA-binding MarR family transcriptional regulator [Friedmanniella endophytica]|uniref:DNA-binding MarR family transcriptional regulator n=1 Tax=Microlunatus kandeliicorticis TaxID=1759536 RepID=A0A7W3P6X4_9ACTN|nr:MarR family winged helix-turn-helix transcriptional regulator [Microlunatus kandeliicorticis]MBA8795433.1 DNA-binding MarR family transcriptional regulator [Microlunatus kandeliicorticis]